MNINEARFIGHEQARGDNKPEPPALQNDGRYWVRTRFGCGWEVRGPDGYVSCAVDTQRQAMEIAMELNTKRLCNTE